MPKKLLLLCLLNPLTAYYVSIQTIYYTILGFIIIRILKQDEGIKKKKQTSCFTKKVKNTTGQNETFRLFLWLPPLSKNGPWESSVMASRCYLLLMLLTPHCCGTVVPLNRPSQQKKSFLESADPSQSASWMAPWQTAWCRGGIFQLLF